LCDTRVIDDVAVQIKPSMFFEERHRIIWRTLHQMINSNEYIDAVTVGKKLRKTGDFDAVGGEAYLLELMKTVPYADHWEEYAEDVRQYWFRRQGMAAAVDMQRFMQDDT